MAATDSVPHTVNVSEIGPSRKRLTFTIPASAVAESLENSLAALASEAALPGFRPGRAPKRLLEKRFGSGMKQEAKNQLVATVYSKAIEDLKLPVLGEPEGNEELAKLDLDPSADMHFHLEVEVMPEFEVPEVDGIEILKPTIEPTPEQVEDQLQKLCINDGTLESQDRAAPGDYCIGHGTMRVKGIEKPVIDIEGAVIQIPPADKGGKGAILGVMVDDFGPQAGSPAADEVIRVKTKGPESHENESVRGKDLEIEFKVARVERIIPATVASLVSKYGHPSEEAFREMVLNRLQQRAKVEQLGAMRQQLAEHLIASTTMELPERLTSRQSERNVHRARAELMYRGMDENQIEEKLAAIRSASSQAAVKELKLVFILAKLGRTMNIRVTEEEVWGRIAQMAAERGVRPADLQRELAQRNQIQLIVQQIHEHKTLDNLLAKAKITEVGVEEFQKRIAAPRE